MKITVMGAGAMGCIFGGYLQEAGEDVWLIHHSDSWVREIDQRGLILDFGTSRKIIRSKSTTRVADAGIADLVLLFTRSYDTASAAQEARPLIGPDTYVLTVQNGLGNVAAIQNATGVNRIIYGTTTVGGLATGPGEVRVDSPPGPGAVTFIGESQHQKSEMLIETSRVFNRAGIPTEIPDDIDQRVWTKVAMASGIGMVAALTGLKVGDLIDLDQGRELLALITAETAEIARRQGIRLDNRIILEMIISHALGSRDHVSSMLLAFREKKRTEAGSLNGALVAEAERLGLSAPANKVVALLVSIIENTYAQRI